MRCIQVIQVVFRLVLFTLLLELCYAGKNKNKRLKKLTKPLKCESKFTERQIAALTKKINSARIYDDLESRDYQPNYSDDEGEDEDGGMDSRFWGPRRIQSDEAPFAAILIREGYLVCNAFFITPLVLLTAAHCIEVRDRDREYFVRYDTAEPLARGTDIRVEKIIIHENFVCGGGRPFDLAMVILSRERHNIGPDGMLSLPLRGEDRLYINSGRLLKFVSSGPSYDSEPGCLLKMTEVRLFTEQCDVLFSAVGFDMDRQLCNKPTDSLITCKGILSIDLFQ